MATASSYSRILVSYLVVLVVPMVTLAGIGYSMASRAAYRETGRHNTELVRRVRAALDREIVQITAIAHAIDRDFEIRHPRVFGDPPDVMAMQRKFSSFVSTNRFIRDVIYAPRGADRYTGSTSVFSPTAVLFEYARRDIIDGYRLNQVIESVRRPGFVLLRETIESDGPFLFYAHPLGLRTDRPAVVLFVIPTTNVMRVVTGVAETTADAPGHFVIIDPFGAVVLAHPPLDRRMLATVQERVRSTAATEVRASVFERHIVAHATSSESGWTTALLTPIAAATTIMRDELRGLLLVILVLILVEIVLLELVVRWNYRPVSVLVQDLEHPERPRSDRDDRLPSELSAVHRALQEAYRSNVRSLSLRELFRELSAADGANRPAPDELLERVGFLPGTTGATAIVIRFAASASVGRPAEDAALSAIGELLPAVGLIDPSLRSLSVLAGGPETAARTACERCRPRLRAVFGSALWIGIGSTASRTVELSDSLHRARDAADRAMLCGSQSILGWNEVDSARESMQLASFADQVDELAAAARSADIDAVRARIDELLTALTDSALTARALRSITHNAISTVTGRLGRSDDSAVLVTEALALDESLALGAVSLGDVRRSIDAVLDRAASVERAQRLAATDAGANGARVTRLVEYVSEHLLEKSFSLTEVARALGMSVSTASTLFKQRVGVTLSVYVSERRIDEAKRLLDTGTPVNEVVDRIGYLDATSFIRKFRKSTGVTPGEWARR